MPKPSAKLKSRAEWITTIGEPTRLAIILFLQTLTKPRNCLENGPYQGFCQRLLAAGDQNVTAIAREMGAEIANISGRLAALKEVDVVSAQRVGSYMIHSLVGATVQGTTLELAHPSGIKFIIPLE